MYGLTPPDVEGGRTSIERRGELNNHSPLLDLVFGSKDFSKDVVPLFGAVSDESQPEKQVEISSPLLKLLTKDKSGQLANDSKKNMNQYIVVQKTFVYSKQ